jgi:hypothetical protein
VGQGDRYRSFMRRRHGSIDLPNTVVQRRRWGMRTSGGQGSIDLVRLLDNGDAYRAMAQVSNPYGDGHASERIVNSVLASAVPEPTEVASAALVAAYLDPVAF